MKWILARRVLVPLALGTALALVLVLAHLGSPSLQAERSRTLRGIELVGAATTHEEFRFQTSNFRFAGRIDSVLGCRQDRDITVYEEMAGSVPDVLVSISSTNDSGVWASTVPYFTEPPGDNTYYAVVAATADGSCDAAESFRIVA